MPGVWLVTSHAPQKQVERGTFDNRIGMGTSWGCEGSTTVADYRIDDALPLVQLAYMGGLKR